MNGELRIGPGHWLVALGVATAVHLGLAVALSGPDWRIGASRRSTAGVESGASGLRLVLGGMASRGPAAARPAPVSGPPEAATTAPARRTPGSAHTAEPSAPGKRSALEMARVAEPTPEPVDTAPVPAPSAAGSADSAGPSDSPGPSGAAQPDAEPTPAGAGTTPGLAGAGSAAIGANGAGAGGSDTDDAYFSALHARIQSRLSYPRRAVRRGIEGTVLVTLRIRRDGALESCEVRTSSGSPLLDRRALRTVSEAAPFDPVPAGLEGELLEVDLPLEYVLR